MIQKSPLCDKESVEGYFEEEKRGGGQNES